ncbi:PAS domain-containing sensor histidine kinase [Brevundimonas sp. Root1423]|uniref:hybrid sensor histidine kinase/response regulator n=1 Tax=Brevundimonas sp. Root1423 TaxID=1736462 RepID=UPI0006F9AA02|nr:PAS domain-containing sensor histidine kinase [Brevundimonas sp. Root1423]KQY89541.1 histidine kinase [Brevundimonas sp. Root1423]
MTDATTSGPIDGDRYRLLVNAITDYAIYMLDAGGHVASWNAGAERFKGYTPAEIVGEHFSRFYTDEDRATGVPAQALHQAATEGRFEQEGWRVRKDGTRFWAHVVIDPIRSPEGGLIGFAKITRDLTERKLAAEALRKSEEEFRLLVEGVTDYAIYMLDPQGRVTTWNAGAQRIKGYRPEEIIGGHFSAFYTEEDRASGAPDEALAVAAREGRFETEALRVRKDGTSFRAHVVIDAIRHEDGGLLGFAKITRDVTERVEAQRALEDAREALFQSQKIEAIGQLTGGIAHDFNNLLMAVMGSLELVRKRLDYDPRVTPLIDNAIQGAERGAVLTQRMLSFARKQELTFGAVDVPVLVRGMSEFIDRTIGPNVEVALRFSPGLPRAHSDPYQLEAALLNLVVNARDAMPRGGAITISAEPVAGAGSMTEVPGDAAFVRISVQDTGEGMDEATLRRATEPFFTTKGAGKGTGLGLSMVHGLAEQSGGRFGLTSREGEGVAAHIWLPVAGKDETAEVASGAPKPASGRRGLRILVVDDDRLVLTNTVAMLEDLGHTVVAAESARQGLAAAQKDPGIDLVITDEVMPRMSGSEMAGRMLESRPGLPIGVVTGYADVADQGRRLSLGLPRLAKPFTQATLAAFVDQLILAEAEPA